jgi:hypothetical protein
LADDDARQPARQRFGEELTPGGYRCDEVASALQKSIRRGLEREALHWASELELGGWGRYVWKRLTIMVSEDVGLAEPHLPATIRALYENWLEESKRSKEERYAGFRRIFLVHAVVLLARARKSRLLDHALVVVYAGERPSPPVPDFALDRHTQAGRRKGRGYRHFVEEGSKLANEGRRPRPLPRGGRGRAQPPAGTARPAPAVRLASCRCDPHDRRRRAHLDAESPADRRRRDRGVHRRLRPRRAAAEDVVGHLADAARAARASPQEPDARPRPGRHVQRAAQLAASRLRVDQHTARGARMGRGGQHFVEEGSKLANEADVDDPYAEEALALVARQPHPPGQLQL